jgi:hypothetical protein
MKKSTDAALLAILIVIFGAGGYKLGSKKERIEVIAAAPQPVLARQNGLPPAEDVQSAVELPASSTAIVSTTTQAEPPKPVQPAPVAAVKPPAKVLGEKVVKTVAPKPAAAAPTPAPTPTPTPAPAVVQQPAVQPEPTTAVS